MHNKKQISLSLIALITIIGIGVIINSNLNNNNSLNKNPISDNEKINTHFKSGIEHMLNKEYSYAVNEWEQLLLINNRIPEAHVNLGFSLVEEKKYQSASEHFSTAMDINPYQANAYYGLAICYEKLGDLKAALGSMRSYVHLTKEGDDTFIRKARSAIWEWENPLDQPFIGKQQSIDAGN